MTWKSDIYRVRNLSSQAVMEEGRNETNDRLRNLDSDRCPVRVGQRRTRKAVETSSDLFDLAAVAQRIERTRMDSESDRIAGAEHVPMFAEDFLRLRAACRGYAHRDSSVGYYTQSPTFLSCPHP